MIGGEINAYVAAFKPGRYRVTALLFGPLFN
jgi:hypothetical protein